MWWKDEKTLEVGYFEWAWSCRTECFPIYALYRDGRKELIGYTTRMPTLYTLPDEAVAVLRLFEFDDGNRLFYVLPKGAYRQYVIDERVGLRIPDGLKLTDPEVAEAVRRAGIAR